MEKGIKRNSKLLIGFVIIVLTILSVVGIYQFKRADDLALAVENQYVHSFHEMTDYIKEMDVLLKKTMLVSNPRQVSALSSEVYMLSAAAKANLALLPTAGTDLSGTSKFLSQVGDYTSYLSAKAIQEGAITDEEYQTLSGLSDYAASVSQHLTELDNQLYEQQLSFEKANEMTAHADNGGSNFATGMEALEETFQHYPALIYDGPFSEHIENLKPIFLQNKLTISHDAALRAAKEFLNDQRAEQLVFAGESGGSMPTYDFTGQAENGREVSISVTKQGGTVLYMLDSRSVTEDNVSVQEAMNKAMAFLNQKGFINMQSSYYEKAGNTATINFAARQNDVILYSDLIKVKVALDNGEILGFESGGYLMNHHTRSLPERMLSAEEISQKINSHLTVDSLRLAMIPLDSKREVLAYECKGKYKDQTFLIYLNAQNGQEEKILMLVETEDGILTV